jgi:hypothetical protein
MREELIFMDKIILTVIVRGNIGILGLFVDENRFNFVNAVLFVTSLQQLLGLFRVELHNKVNIIRIFLHNMNLFKNNNKDKIFNKLLKINKH